MTTSEILEAADPRAALDVALEAARLADPLISTPDGRRFVLAPQDFQVKDISDPDRPAAFIKQRVTVDDRASLVNYANRFRDARSILIADYDTGTVRAALDWHRQAEDDEGQPPHLDPSPASTRSR